MNKVQKIIGSLALGAVLTTSMSLIGFAQSWPRNGQWEQQRRDRDDRWDDRNERRNDRWNDGYNNNRYNSYAREQFEKGYRNGLDRGRKDAQTNRVRTPNNSSHYREGNRFYREGFERGFFEAYDQYSYNGRSRNRRW